MQSTPIRPQYPTPPLMHHLSALGSEQPKINGENSPLANSRDASEEDPALPQS